MRLARLLFISLILAALVVPVMSVVPVGAVTLYENYNTGDDNGSLIYSTVWNAQTFTPASSHTILKVNLKLIKVGNPGTITVSIRATDAGKPTGVDLCSGTTNGNTLSLSTSEWRLIELGAGTALTAGTF